MATLWNNEYYRQFKLFHNLHFLELDSSWRRFVVLDEVWFISNCCIFWGFLHHFINHFTGVWNGVKKISSLTEHKVVEEKSTVTCGFINLFILLFFKYKAQNFQMFYYWWSIALLWFQTMCWHSYYIHKSNVEAVFAWHHFFLPE